MNRKSLSISQFEKKQITQATFRRNKIYLDLDKIERQEKIQSMKNRQPLSVEKSPKSQKINNNISSVFRHSVKELNNKLEEETRRFKERVCFSPVNNQKFISPVETGYQTERTTYQNPQNDESTHSIQLAKNFNKTSVDFNLYRKQNLGENKIKGIPIDKQITRDYLYRYSVERHYAVDERNFNNFYLTKADLSKTQDFKKLSPRNINFVNQNINDLNYNSQKKYQKFYFSTKPMKSTFRMNLQNDKKGRTFFQPKRQQNIAKTALDNQKIRKSFAETCNFKPNKIDPFYKMTGRQYPHQLDQRRLSPNCNFYKDQQGKLRKPQVDFAVKKLYDDLIRKQQEQNYRKKNPEFTRDEICDQKYFNEMIKRENKMKKFGRP